MKFIEIETFCFVPDVGHNAVRKTLINLSTIICVLDTHYSRDLEPILYEYKYNANTKKSEYVQSPNTPTETIFVTNIVTKDYTHIVLKPYDEVKELING